jgi:hypothetical protein
MRLLMTGFAELEEAVDAINRGEVYRYLAKPWHADALHEALKHASRTFVLERSHEQLLDQLRQLNQDLEGRVVQRTRVQAMQELEQKNKMLEAATLIRSPACPIAGPWTDWPKEIRRRDLSLIAIGLIDVVTSNNNDVLAAGGDKVWWTWVGRDNIARSICWGAWEARSSWLSHRRPTSTAPRS